MVANTMQPAWQLNSVPNKLFFCMIDSVWFKCNAQVISIRVYS